MVVHFILKCYLVCVCVYVRMHTMAHSWRAEDSFVESILIFHIYIGSWDQNHIISLVWQVPHTRSRLWSMVVHFLFLLFLLFFFSFLFLLTYFIERDLLCIPDYQDKAGLELTEIQLRLPLPPVSWD